MTNILGYLQSLPSLSSESEMLLSLDRLAEQDMAEKANSKRVVVTLEKPMANTYE